MVNQLEVKNFKSIRKIDFACKKVNVFIGGPNTGKSNIIEALCLMSQGVVGQVLSKEVFRYNSVADLFFDFNINQPIELFTNQFAYKLMYAVRQDGVPENQFNFEVSVDPDRTLPAKNPIKIDYDGKIVSAGQLFSTIVRCYQYKRLQSFQPGYLPFLSPPFGENLPSLLLSNEDLRNWVSEFFESMRFNLTLKPVENQISISKLVNKSIFSYPYLTISETLQRIVFYIVAIKSNKNSILLFDEPDSNTFPFYTKFLAERIALDDSNQFFITTHNPYLLLGLIEKTSIEDLNVSLVTMTDNYETKVNPLNSHQLEEVLDFNSDVFFNLDRIVE